MSENAEGATVLPRDGYPAGVPSFVDTTQPDAEAAERFYGGLFGWEFDEIVSGRYWLAKLDGLDVAGLSVLPDNQPSWNTYIEVDSVDRATADAMQLGAHLSAPELPLEEE